MTHVSVEGLEATLNRHGFMHKPSPITDSFAQFASKQTLPCLDIGCAFGVATIKALTLGACVVAIDKESAHIDTLLERVPDQLKNNLKTFVQEFPNHTEFNDATFSAICASNLLSFISDEDMDYGLNLLYRWLVPYGRLFIINYSIYLSTYQDFIDEYHKRKEIGVRWPGYLQDFQSATRTSPMTGNLPKSLNTFDLGLLSERLEEVGFNILEKRYLHPLEYPFPKELQLDGRERIAIIAEKPL